MNISKIVSVTKEKIFGLSLVNDDTELIFIDKWSENTFNIPNIKYYYKVAGWSTQPNIKMPKL